MIGDLAVGALAEPLAGQRFASVFARDDLASLPAQTPVAASPDLAHLLFTSGSTGAPKGVMIEHANVVAFVEWALRHFGTRAGDRISGHPPLHFDLSTFDIYATLAAGAELHLVPASLGLDPKGTARFIRDRELTQWFSVPSVLTYLARFDAVAQDDFPSLERLLWCGEVLPTPVLAHWMRRLPHVRFTNLYGPTEATIASSFYDVPEVPPDESVPVPIGLPCDGESLVVLDGDTPAPVGGIGELHIGGVGLSPGYWRDEEKTAAAFRADPRDPTRADLSHRGPRPGRRRRHRALPRPHRLADQEPRLPHRARRDRVRGEHRGRRAGVRRRRRRHRRVRGRRRSAARTRSPTVPSSRPPTCASTSPR